MLIKDSKQSRLLNLLDKGIIVGSYIFALAALTSKGASSVGVGLACLFWLIRIVITKNYNYQTTKLTKPILFFLAGLLISGLDVWSLQFFDAIEKMLLAILFYYALVNTIDSLDTVKKLSYTALFSMVVGAGYGFYQKFYLQTTVNSFSFTLSFGCLLAMFLMFSLAYLFWGRVDWQQRLGLLLLTVTMGLNLLFTESRGAWLAFIGGSFSLAFLRDKRVIIGLVVCLAVLPFILPDSYIQEFKSSFDLKNNRSNLGRLALWKGSWLMYQDHPINGVGMGYFTDVYYNHYKQPNTTNAAHAHNNFLHFLATMGTIGFVAFCWLLFKIMKLMFVNYRQLPTNWQLFVLASLTAIIVFNIQGLTEFNFGDTETVRFFWFLVALTTVVIGKKEVILNEN